MRSRYNVVVGGLVVAAISGCGPLPPGAGDTQIIPSNQYVANNPVQVTHSLEDTQTEVPVTVQPGPMVFHVVTYANRQIPEVKMNQSCVAVPTYGGNTRYHIHPGQYRISLVTTNPVTHKIRYGINWGLSPDLGGPIDNWLFITPSGNVAQNQRFQMNGGGWDSWPGGWSLQPKGCRFQVISNGQNLVSDLKVYYMGRTPSGLLQFSAMQNGHPIETKIVPAQPGEYSPFGVNVQIINVHRFTLTYKIDEEPNF